ncbi:C-type lectin 37Db-like [Calliphora vicina]|uniref:C-type lectin 37Db-like n=1 Tax=Calliphora vicina TaxID=7373 RepID=UPI00325B3510
MRQNILKICLVVSLAAVTLATHTPQVSTTILDGFPNDLNIHPFVNVGNKLYHFGQSKVTWYKAFLICRSLGGFLASFDNQQELAALSDYMVGKYPLDRWWWLSGSDQDSEGDFYWYRTGERISYADWSGGQPDNAGGHENCVHLWYQNPKYQMNDWMCNQPAYYVCEADKPKTIAVSVF